MLSKMSTELRGISAIPVTPFDSKGNVDEAALQNSIARMLKAGIKVVVACGNTSEFLSLTPREIEEVTKSTIDAAKGAITIVGVGGDVNSAKAQARHAISSGAQGVMIHFPNHPYISDDGLIEYYRAIASETEGAVELYLRGKELSRHVFDSVVKIENVIAVKYAITDLMGFANFVENYGSAVVPICGLAEIWAPFYASVGGTGFTSGLANVAPTLSLELLSSIEKGDSARTMELWKLIKPFEDLRAVGSSSLNVSVVKEAMAQINLISNPTVRPPISTLSDNHKSEITSILKSWKSFL